MSVFDIDYGINGLGRQELPVDLRSEPRLEWLAALLSGVKVTYEEFLANRGENLYELAHTGQVCYLEAVLNDVFDDTDRGIFISDGPFIDPDFIYRSDELKPLFIDLVSEIGGSVIPDPDPVPLYTVAETYPMGVQFVVNVPAGLGLDAGELARLRALVDKYRLVSKNTYTIVTF
jgi:hypothetical protein